jgi:DNA-binding NarL/FixJ family response regulator
MSKNSPPIRVAVVDDDKRYRQRIETVIASAAGLQFVGGFDSPESALKELPTAKPDVILLDIDLKASKSGVDLVFPIKKVLPNSKIVMLTVQENPALIRKAMFFGACGYLLKSIPTATMPAKIREAFEGGLPLSPEVGGIVVKPLCGNTEIKQQLSPAQLKVLEQAQYATSDKAIAESLGRSPNTVRTHWKKILQVLGEHTRLDAIRRVFQSKS